MLLSIGHWKPTNVHTAEGNLLSSRLPSTANSLSANAFLYASHLLVDWSHITNIKCTLFYSHFSHYCCLILSYYCYLILLYPFLKIIFECKSFHVFQSTEIQSWGWGCISVVECPVFYLRNPNQPTRQKTGNEQLTHVDCFMQFTQSA